MCTVVGWSEILANTYRFQRGPEYLDFGAFEPLVFVSLGAWGQASPQERPFFPAVVDTGFGGVLALQLEHLRDFVGFNEDVAANLILGTQLFGKSTFPEIRITPRGAVCPIYGNLFIWDRIRSAGRIEKHPSRSYLMELDREILVYLPPELALELAAPELREQLETLAVLPDTRPRVPLLGIRAFCEHRLRLAVRGRRFCIQRPFF